MILRGILVKTFQNKEITNANYFFSFIYSNNKIMLTRHNIHIYINIYHIVILWGFHGDSNF